MSPLLVASQIRRVKLVTPTERSHDQHVRIVPMPRPSKLVMADLPEADERHASPVVRNVPSRPPVVAACLGAPFPYLAHSILAHAEDNVAATGVERLAHQSIRSAYFLRPALRSDLLIRAPIILDQINAPCRPCPG